MEKKRSMIDQAIINRILDTADIVQVISEFVTLRKRGANFMGLCPFHNEKTPSFSVSPSRRIFKCFSCGKAGNVIHFLMEHEQLSYVEAIKWLGRKYGIDVPDKEMTPEEMAAQGLRESLFVVNSFARDYFQHVLHDTEDGNIGMQYFRSRGFRDDIIKKFQLGFCPNGRNNFATEAKEKGYKEEFLLKTGLCYETSEGKVQDRFWGRVMFPVLSLSGKVVAFGGRVMNTENKKLAKYVNSPESEIYHKSNELYGIFFAKQAIVKQDCCYLVEGYTDVISMHQSGIENVVASSGTSLTEGQIRMIHRFTNHITVLYDGDMAGIKASLRGIDMLLAEGMSIKVLLLPDGDDPDSFARKHNATEYQAFIKEHEVDFIRFKTNILLSDAGDDPIKKAELIKNIVHSIAVIPEAIVRDVYIKECSELMQVTDKLLVTEVAKDRTRIREAHYKEQYRAEEQSPIQGGNAETKEETSATSAEPADSAIEQTIVNGGKDGKEFYKYEEMIVKMVIRYGEKTMCMVKDQQGNSVPLSVIEYVASDMQRDHMKFYNAIFQQILDDAVAHLHDEQFSAQRYFVAHPDPIVSEAAVNLIATPYQLSKIFSGVHVPDENRLYELMPMLMTNYKYALISEELKDVTAQLKDPSIVSDSEKCNAILARFNELHQTQSLMAQKLGERVILPS
jgi:DNA primase